MLLIFVVALLVLALLLVLLHRYRRVRGGLPVGELIYSDDVSAESPVLISTRYGLKGRPDALIRTKSGEIIPVERKSSRAPQRPYDGDLIQAAAYCVLVQEQYGSRPPYMRIQYQDGCFDEPFTLERERWVLRTCEQIRLARRSEGVRRSHQSVARCNGCGQRSNCDQALMR